jgi:hypothetical protein
LGGTLNLELLSECLKKSGTIILCKRCVSQGTMVWSVVGMAPPAFAGEPSHPSVN